jgi:hypothetical protein
MPRSAARFRGRLPFRFPGVERDGLNECAGLPFR